MYSESLRLILQKLYNVNVGLYSYGPCLKPGTLPDGTIIGRYCSFAEGIAFFRRNHPTDRLSTHPFFYNKLLGCVDSDKIHAIDENPLSIGNDVWIGYNVTILPGCKSIGDGAVIGAGAVVTKSIPAFAIAVGNPARVIARRMPDDTASLIAKSNWWSEPIEKLQRCIEIFGQPATVETVSVLIEKIGESADQPRQHPIRTGSST